MSFVIVSAVRNSPFSALLAPNASTTSAGSDQGGTKISPCGSARAERGGGSVRRQDRREQKNSSILFALCSVISKPAAVASRANFATAAAGSPQGGTSSAPTPSTSNRIGATGRWQLRRAQNHAIAASSCSGSTEMYASAAVEASRSTAVAGSSVGRQVTLPSPLTFSVSGGVKSRPQLLLLQHHSYRSFMVPTETSWPDMVAAAVQPSMASATSCHGSTTNLPTPVTFSSNRRSSASTQALFSHTASSTLLS